MLTIERTSDSIIPWKYMKKSNQEFHHSINSIPTRFAKEYSIIQNFEECIYSQVDKRGYIS